MSPPKSIVRARELRRDMTPPERKLWKLLRHHQMRGLHWRRQHPIGNYYADFACSRARLVVELDGASHADRQDADANRDEALCEWGWTTLRFSNADFARSPDGVWQKIAAFLKPLAVEDEEKSESVNA